MDPEKQVGDEQTLPNSDVVTPSETIHQMKQRHKLELKALKESVTKGKGAKKARREEEQKLIKRHTEELELAKQRKKGLIMDKPVAMEHVIPTKQHVRPTKLSKAQRRRNRKEERERLRKQQIEEETKGMKDLRGDEMEKLEKKLAAFSLVVEEIPADGHCLYRAIGDQLRRRGCLDGIGQKENEPLYITLRHHAAEQIRLNKSYYQNFLPDTDIEHYCDDIIGTEKIVWGGHIEIAALAEAMQHKIVVHSAEGEPLNVKPLKMGPKVGVNLHISFHKHYYGLGEHYNSLRNT